MQREEREELFNAIIVELRAVELEVERAATAKKEEEVSLLLCLTKVDSLYKFLNFGLDDRFFLFLLAISCDVL